MNETQKLTDRTAREKVLEELDRFRKLVAEAPVVADCTVEADLITFDVDGLLLSTPTGGITLTVRLPAKWTTIELEAIARKMLGKA